LKQKKHKFQDGGQGQSPVRMRTLPNLSHRFNQKNSTLIVRLISTAQTGFFYTTQRPRLGPKLAAVKYDPQGPCVCATSHHIPSYTIPSRPIYHLPFVSPSPPLFLHCSAPFRAIFSGELMRAKEKKGGGRLFRYRHHDISANSDGWKHVLNSLLFYSFSVKRRVLFVEGKKTKK
jgi:ribosomal protein L33